MREGCTGEERVHLANISSAQERFGPIIAKLWRGGGASGCSAGGNVVSGSHKFRQTFIINRLL